ncbi:MAG: phosphatase PAP2 family protein [Coriobacteriia bacterium]|nr:phosphatase PAP2 family protein [Coriobacteriia bacterium]
MPGKITLSLAVTALISVVLAALTMTGRFAALDCSLAGALYALRTPALTTTFKVITTAGEWYVYAAITLLLLALPKTRWNYGLPAGVALGASAVLNALLKQCFAIPRPTGHRLISETGFGFPSGHAMIGAAFVGLCTLVFVKYASRRGPELAASVMAVLFMLAVGLSRVYLGVHNPSDIIAGYAMGLCCALGIRGLIDLLPNPKNPHARDRHHLAQVGRRDNIPEKRRP